MSLCDGSHLQKTHNHPRLRRRGHIDPSHVYPNPGLTRNDRLLAYWQVRGDAWSRSLTSGRWVPWARHQGGLARVEEGILGEVLG